MVFNDTDNFITVPSLKMDNKYDNFKEQMFKLLENGGKNRTTASTLMNDASSRSHAIFTIFIKQILYS